MALRPCLRENCELKGKHIFKLALLYFVVLFCPSSSNAFNDTTLVDKNDWKVVFGGFVETDVITDTTRSFAEVVGNSPVLRQGSVAGDNGRTQYSLRNSRFSLAALPPVTNGWKTKGFMEFDFLGYVPNPAPGGINEANYLTSPTLRLRLAYTTAESNGWQILVGQYWTLFGWDSNYILKTLSVAPVAGVTFERTPQVRLTKILSLGDASDLELAFAGNRPTQSDAVVPTFDMGTRWVYKGRRAGYTSAIADVQAQPMSLGFSGTIRKYQTGITGGATDAKNHYIGSAFAVDAMVPIMASASEKEYGNTLSFSCEFTIGRGYADQFSGWSGNISQLPNTVPPGNTTNLDAGMGGYNSDGVFSLINLQTLTAQFQYHFPEKFLGGTYTTLGYGRLYSNNVASMIPVTANIAYDSVQTYFLNVFHDFTRQIRVGLEYGLFATHYVDGAQPKNVRVQGAAWFRF